MMALGQRLIEGTRSSHLAGTLTESYGLRNQLSSGRRWREPIWGSSQIHSRILVPVKCLRMVN